MKEHDAHVGQSYSVDLSSGGLTVWINNTQVTCDPTQVGGKWRYLIDGSLLTAVGTIDFKSGDEVVAWAEILSE